MLAPVVKPLGISAVSASVLVFIETVFLGSLPTLALAATFVGPFVPLVTGGLGHRRATALEDVQLVYDPLYEEIRKNKEHILSAKNYGQLPMFERPKIDQIRIGARYSIVKNQAPAVEALCKSMDLISDNQGGAHTTASRIIAEIVRGNPSIFRYEGDGIALRGKNTEGSDVNFAGGWITNGVLLGFDPLGHFRQLGIKITNMDITEKTNNIKGTLQLPTEEPKYRFLWENVEKRAKEDIQIMKVHDALSGLPRLANEAESQVFDKIKKSRRTFW
jgi:hypothetical protein